jgi:hypothetical protein
MWNGCVEPGVEDAWGLKAFAAGLFAACVEGVPKLLAASDGRRQSAAGFIGKPVIVPGADTVPRRMPSTSRFHGKGVDSSGLPGVSWPCPGFVNGRPEITDFGTVSMFDCGHTFKGCISKAAVGDIDVGVAGTKPERAGTLGLPT